MRRFVTVGVVLLAGAAFLGTVVDAHREEAETPVTIYDSDPAHLWNRLHSVLFVREDLPSTRSLPDALDPPYWYNTRYLLGQPSHRRLMRVLDAFLQSHAENLIHDPLKRALLQRDLWAVFDWSYERSPENDKDRRYEKEKQELEARLGEIIRRVALSPDEIRSLPHNYDQAVASEEFAAVFDPAQRDRAFLPPDLFDPGGPWVEIEGSDGPNPVAEQHVSGFFGRSSFSIFIRLPGGRKAAFDYLQTLWNSPESTIPSPNYAPNVDVAPNPHLPQFPQGTEFALLRQMILIDNQGQMVLTPITESVQIRVYSKIEESSASRGQTIQQEISTSGQSFYEFTLNRAQLFARTAGGLRATGRDEKQYFVFNSPGPDHGRVKYYPSLDKYPPVLEQCILCHGQTGINSVQSRIRWLKPHLLQKDRPHTTDGRDWWQDPRTIAWKQKQDAWTLMQRYWNGTSAH